MLKSSYRSTEASWHADYRDTAYIYIGGLPFDLSEGDIIAIFSQFGEPVYINLIRDKESGKSKGYAFLKYEDQRSTDLAVDNLGGATVMGRVLKVDHTRYKRKDDEEEAERELALSGQKATENGDGDESQASEGESEEQRRPLLKEEKQLAALIRDHDKDDPMKEFLVQEKKAEVTKALAALAKKSHHSKSRKHGSHSHHHRHHHRPHSGHIRKPKEASVSEGDRTRRHRSPRRRSRSP